MVRGRVSSRGIERCRRFRVVREGDTGRVAGSVHIVLRYPTVMWLEHPVVRPNRRKVPRKSRTWTSAVAGGV